MVGSYPHVEVAGVDTNGPAYWTKVLCFLAKVDVWQMIGAWVGKV